MTAVTVDHRKYRVRMSIANPQDVGGIVDGIHRNADVTDHLSAFSLKCAAECRSGIDAGTVVLIKGYGGLDTIARCPTSEPRPRFGDS